MKRILIIQTASLGDVVLCTPLIEKLHHFYPKAKIDFLLKYGYEEVLRYHPYLHHVVVWEKQDKKYAHLFELIRIFREKKYDLIVNAQRFASSGLITVFSQGKSTVGFSKNPFALFFNRRVKHKIGKISTGLHEVERNLKLIDHVTDTSVNFPMKLYPSSLDFAKVSQFKTKRYITLSPGSLWLTKQLPVEKWIEMIKQLDEYMVVYLLGSGKESKLCEQIISDAGRRNCLNLAGKLSFLQSAALMKDAAMNFVNDSAPMHFASAVNAPVSAIYCSTVPEFGFGPRSEQSYIVQTQEELKCRPCGLHGYKKCPKSHFKCGKTINVKQLLDNLPK